MIKSLANSSILYSASSSFVALSGNTDLLLHSSNQTPAASQESEQRSVRDGDENSSEDGTSETVKKRKAGETLREQSECEPQNDKKDDEEEPINHLLEVRIVSWHHMHVYETFCKALYHVAVIFSTDMALLIFLIDTEISRNQCSLF